MLHKQTFSAVKKKEEKKLGKSFLLIKSSARKGWLLMHIRSHSELFLYLVLYSPHTHSSLQRMQGISALHHPHHHSCPPISLAVKCLALMLDITVRRFLAQHQTARRILVPPSGHFSQYQHRFAFQDVGISQEQYYGMLKQGQQGEPMQRKSCRNIQRKTQHLTLMWKLLN